MTRKTLASAVAVAGLAGAVGIGGAVAGHAATGGQEDTRMTFFIRDTSQLTVDLGKKGPGHGDLFDYHGRVLTQKGGAQIGRFGGSCTTLGASAGVPEDWTCWVDYILPRGQLYTEVIDTSAHLFSGKKFTFGILGGTGAYRDARGDGTMSIPTDVKNQTDGYVSLDIR